MTTVIVNGKKYTLEDMQKWFVQIRGFPSILYFGSGKNQVSGEGQSGGRMVTEIAKAAEQKFIEKMGVPKYQAGIDKIMRRKGEGG